MPEYQIVESTDASDPNAYEPRGQMGEFWRCRDQEVMLCGSAETGKTRCSLELLDALAWKYSKMQAVIVRKIRGTIVPSVVQTYINKVLKGDAVKPYGGKNPEWFDYPNGSRIWLAGMDDPGKALSSERDIIYVNQAEELKLEDWETLLTRATGRAGNMPYSKVMGDCNPDGPHHWILSRRSSGKMRFFTAVHEDNPTLWDAVNKRWTPQGERTIAILDGLTGVRYWRLRRGEWRAAEGIVYEDYDSSVHRVSPFKVPSDWRRIRSIDFGFKNPFVCQWWAIRPEDGAMFLYRELYGTKRIVAEWATKIKELSEGEDIEVTITDHDAEDRATLDHEGIKSIAAMKDISSGIQAVQKRLKDKRVFFMDGALVERDPSLDEKRKPACTVEEIDSYVWPKAQDGRPLKEVPIKENDHGADSLRYVIAYIDKAGEQLRLPKIKEWGSAMSAGLPPVDTVTFG